MKRLLPLVLLALVLAAPSARAAAVTPPDQTVLIDTSASAGSVVASSSSSATYSADHAFDGNWADNAGRWLAYTNPDNDYGSGVHGETPMYLVYRFNVPTKVNVLRLLIQNANEWDKRSPKAWTFLGSHDGETWTTLDTRSGVAWASGTVTKSFSFENQTAYEYYKFSCTEILGENNYMQLYEIQFLYDTGIVLTDLTTATSGSVSSASGTHGSYPATKAFDGNRADTNGRWLSSIGDHMYLVYRFNDATAVNAIRVWNGSDSAGGWNSTGRAPKTWTFSGSNDGETWTTLDTQASETGWAANGESRYYAFENNTPYEYYKYDCTALNGGTDYLQLWELEFFYVNTGSPALGIVSLSRTGAAAYSLSATEDANAADLAWIADAGTATTTNGWQSVAEGGTANWTVSGLATDTTYEISVLATNENGTAETVAGTIYTGALSFGAATDADEAGLVTGGVTVSRAAADPLPLTVNYSISGSAGTEGTTWAAPVAVTIPAGASSATLPVVPLLDFDVDEDVTITVTILAGNYELPAAATTTLTLRNRAAVKKADFAKSMTLTPSETALAKIGETAWADFPVLVRLPAEASALLQSADGTDLFFTDENDASLPFEVETFDPAGTTFVWVKVPSLSAATELTVWFGGASNQDNDPTAVWSRYVGVWHYAPSDAGGSTVADATGHGLTGSTTGALSTYAGPFGGDAIHGTATVTAPNYDALVPNAGQFTASGWFKAPSQVGDYLTFVSKKTGLNWDDAKGWYLEMAQSKTKMNLVLGNSTTSATIPDVSANWNYFSIVSDGTNVKVYMNGSTSASITKAYAVTASGRDFVISPNKADNCTDEYRIRKGAAGAAETALEYATMADAAFFDLGAIESVDDTAQVFETPTVARNANGTYTVTAVLLENNGDVGVLYDAGATAVTNILQSAASPGTFTDTPANLAADTTYKFAAYGKNANGTEVVAKGGVFYNGDLSIEKISDAVENGLVPGVFRISRADTAHDLTVAYTIGGTAAAGQTYAALSGTATIPAGSTSVDVEVVPLLDAATTEDKTVALALASGLYGIDAQAGSAEMTVVNLVVPTGFNTWVATAPGLASVGSNWSAGHAPLATEQVLFDGRFSTADCEWDAAASATVASWTQTNGYSGTVTVDTVFPDKGAFTVLTVSGDMAVASGTVTHKAHNATNKEDYYRLRIDVGGNLTVASGVQVHATGKGAYGPHTGTGSGAYGGSYNGYASWGSLTEPYGVGSSPAADGTYNAPAGGAIWIEVAGGTTLDGAIRADSVSAWGQWNGYSGSGGAVYLKTATLSGSGKISADCTNTSSGSNQDTGAGGRVSILLTGGELSAFPDANLTALGGVSSYAKVGSVGTILVRSPLKPNGVLYLRDRTNKYGMYAYRPKPNQLTRIPAGQTWVLDEIVFGANAILEVPTGTPLDLRGGLASVSSTGNTLDETGLIVDGGTLLLPSAATHTISGKWLFEPTDFALDGNLVVTNGAGVGTLLLYSDTSNNVRRCGLSVSGDMHVASGSYLRALRGGYIATGAATVGGGSTSCHGGQCGKSTANVAYDSFFRPRHPGTFGADNGRVNVGGGAIRLAVGGTLTLDGVASATPIVADARSGAPGAIDITAARLEGAGRIEANGNSRNYGDNDTSNASGGGRIAVRLTGAGETLSDAWIAKINAKGFYSSSISVDRCSSAGSIYLQTADQAEGAGTIVVRNTGNTANNVAFTALPSLKAGGEEDDFRKASLSVEAAARVKLFADLRMASLGMAAGTALDLNGHAFAVTTARVGETNIAPGTYTAAQLQALGFDEAIDTADGAGGTLRVLGAATVLIVK